MLKDYKVLEGQKLQDIAVLTYGSTEYVSKLILDNNLGFDSNVTGLTLIYDNSVSYNIPSTINVNNQSISNDIQKVTIVESQSFYDIAIQTQSTIENIIQLALDNKISLNNFNILKGSIINYSKQKIKDYSLYNFIQNLNTGISSSPMVSVKNKSFNISFNISFN